MSKLPGLRTAVCCAATPSSVMNSISMPRSASARARIVSLSVTAVPNTRKLGRAITRRAGTEGNESFCFFFQKEALARGVGGAAARQKKSVLF
jgi:hypothetical protein